MNENTQYVSVYGALSFALLVVESGKSVRYVKYNLKFLHHKMNVTGIGLAVKFRIFEV